MKGLQKTLIRAVEHSWKVEFPFLKPAKAPGLESLPAFVCDKYLTERNRAYFFAFQFSQIKSGRFYLNIMTSDLTSLADSRGKPPSATQLGLFRLNNFEGIRQDQGWHLTGLTSIDPHVLQKRIDDVISDLNLRLRKSVFPRLQIEVTGDESPL